MKQKNQHAKSVVAKQTKRTLKQWMTIAIFSGLVLVFAFLGISPGRLGGGSAGDGGVAATVNDSPILLSEYQAKVQEMEARTKQQLAQFPEALRRQFEQDPQFGLKAVRKQALDSLVNEEVIYQAAKKRGVVVPDAEVRDNILDIGFLKENGSFMRERYQAFLQNQNLSSEDFERHVRKLLTQQKLQELFAGSTLSVRAEANHNLELKKQKVALRFVQIKHGDLAKPGFVTDDEVAKFLTTNKAEVEAYYKNNQVEYMRPESVHARHILIRVGEKQDDEQARKLINDLKKQATAKNFAELAMKNSEDPGSKSKGGDLGDFQRGRMAPEFDAAAFSTPAGEISPPVKTNFGYHLIYVEKKTPGSTVAFAEAQDDIARKLFARNKEADVIAKTKALLKRGDKAEIEAFLHKAGLKWNETGEFDLSVPEIPKMHESQQILSEVVRHGKTPGMIGDLINSQGDYFIVDVASWKEVPAPTPATAGNERDNDYRMFSIVINAWASEIVSKANIQLNPRITQQ